MNPWNLIPWGISAASLAIAIFTYANNNRKGLKDAVTERESRLNHINEGLLKANMKLDAVCATTNETRTDVKALNTSLSEIDKRVSVIERDMQTAFMRIDELKEGKADK
jgi:septal ring factor EnvC (AmiA/AmiB activator)